MATKESEIEDSEKPVYVVPYNEWFAEKNGAWWLPTFFEVEKDIRALDVKQGDVWIVSVPKSGTTWMQEMAWLLTHNLDFEGAKKLLKYRSPGLEGCWTHRFFKNHDVSLSEFERLASFSGGRRILKTHLQYDFLPEKLQDPNSPAKDLEKVVREVATFLDEPVPEGAQMKKLLDHLSFNSMKKNPAVNREQGEDKLLNKRTPDDVRFIRKGIVGGWKGALSPERIKKFDEWIKENSKDIDLTFEEYL